MKTTKNMIIAAVMTAAIAFLANSTNAQQPKGGENLVQLNGSALTATGAPTDHKPMSCEKCKDVATHAPDLTSSGLGAKALTAHGVPTKAVVAHLCGGCETTVKVAALGKNSPPDVVTHACAKCGPGNAAGCITQTSGK
jgi:hypothetical protein